ncbi:bifunctional metallophosphatase/5'-nucleotidase [Kibdelosporangium phytohabitans]|uniref:5'-nucleotidase n=1 Tax=Kibdelosporangium phytohabitans TaxID=860235 RepID=A0A0N9HY15_9PSEU|nr:bifunctional metallophosphatase/5'-nucleotidase [Kibdelosporangium phytohabitans]ALG12200.1 hypothetical protein AOZ06_39855 [Kibdelosporangium phytohabitans]MBE1463732.1 5'-nucleotidase [Kibdelosporangium phytohabitans]
MSALPRRWRGAAIATAALLAVSPAPTATAEPAPGVPVQLLSITDLHGYFGEYTTTVPGSHAGEPAKTVGGGAYLASHLNRLRAPMNSVLFSAGDDFSGWPSETAWFWNEPTIEYMNMIGVEFSTVGNHEIDRKPAYLEHMMKGTCRGRPDRDLCFTDSTGKRFQGADFDYYSANVINEATGRPLVKPYHVRQVDDGRGGTLPVGFIHATTTHTPQEQLSYWPSELKFLPEAETINRYAEELRGRGVQAIVAVVHEGFSQANGAGYNDCTAPFGPLADMNKQISPAVDAIVGGHWHALVNCMLPDPAGNPRPVVDAANHGRLINEINLELDPATGDVRRDRTTSVSHANTRDVAPDPEVQRMAKYWKDRLPARGNQQVATVTGDLTRTSGTDEESTLGNVTADAFLWAANKDGQADLAVAMPGILLRDVLFAPNPANPADAPGRVLFSELVFGTVYENGIGPAVVRGTVTGEKLDELIESQWQRGADGVVTYRHMAVSGNVSYTYDPGAPLGQHVDIKKIRINGKPVKAGREYRIATLANNFFARNATPGFTALFEARNQDRSIYSGADALWKYMEARSPVRPPKLDRVRPAPGNRPA